MAAARLADVPPRSSFTASAPPSLTNRMAVRTAWASDTSYEPNGRSATSSGRRSPRCTARTSTRSSSTVTGDGAVVAEHDVGGAVADEHDVDAGGVDDLADGWS